MNRTRVTALADHLDGMTHAYVYPQDEACMVSRCFEDMRAPEAFSMKVWRLDCHDCGTVCCLAGTTVALWPQPFSIDGTHIPIAAQAILGLGDWLPLDVSNLFIPNFLPDLRLVTPQQAARCLRGIAAGDPPMSAWHDATDELPYAPGPHRNPAVAALAGADEVPSWQS